MLDNRPITLSLAAGTILDVTPSELVACAAAAGFQSVGLRIDPDGVTPTLLRQIRRQLDDHRVRLLDLEVVRLRPHRGDDEAHRLIEIGAELGAGHLLLVSHDEQPRTVERFRRVCERASGVGLRVALEFMVFTSVKTLDQAVTIVEAAGHPAGCVLVDTLHLERTGGSAADLARVPPGRLPYIQLADAARAGRDDDEERCTREARTDRVMPGEGVLPLVDVVSAYLVRPGAEAISVEVQSSALAERHAPLERARLAMSAARRVLGSVRSHGT